MRLLSVLILCVWLLSACESSTDDAPLSSSSNPPITTDVTHDDADATESSTSRTTYSRLYGYIYWEHGIPLSDAGRRPDSWVTEEMKNNPDLVIQTGYYNLRFATDELALTGFDASDGSDYLTALTEDVDVFHRADLHIEIDVNGITYTATSAQVENSDPYRFNVNLIEQGQYVQRFDHLGLVFTDANGNALITDAYHHFEITAWPDRVVFTLDMSGVDGVTRSQITVTSPHGVEHSVNNPTNKVNLAIQPNGDTTLTPMDPNNYIIAATGDGGKDNIKVTFDSDQYAFFFDLPAYGVWYNNGINNTYKEIEFEINNPTNEETNIPLVFNLNRFNTVTGTVMTLVEEDGRPSGYAVQVSKNWHGVNKDDGRNHYGYWHQGAAMVPVAANSSRKLKLRIIYGYWDSVGTASHSHLSLIGYSSKAWQWDESALGAWGESMTFSPYSCIGSAFMDDIRPTWTTPSGSASDHAWTENLGGGDYLVYFDHNGDFRWPKKLKTAYYWTGPNMTQIYYSGVTDNDAIRFTYGSHLVRTNDYHRRFQQYHYSILKDISPTRLVYYQMATDYYMTPNFDDFYLGDSSGLSESVIHSEKGGNQYLARYPFTNRWLAIDDLATTSNTANANRGLIWRNANINGSASSLYLHTYGRSWGAASVLFGFGGSSTTPNLTAGTTMSGELEFVLPAKSTDVYWGYDENFRARLGRYSWPWEAVKDEYTYNDMIVTASKGEIKNNYPIEIESQANITDVQFTIPANKGIGHLPIIIKHAPAHQALYAEILIDDQWQPAVENPETFANHAYYQGYLNADGSMDYVFNITRPPNSLLNEPMQIRIIAAE